MSCRRWSTRLGLEFPRTEDSPIPVPLFDTSTPLAPLRHAIEEAIIRGVDSQRFILGPEVRGFEQEFASYRGARDAVGVANGTEAITCVSRSRNSELVLSNSHDSSRSSASAAVQRTAR